MKKLTVEEASKLIPMKKGKHTWLYIELMQLKPGEGIIINRADWKTKTTPYKTIRGAEGVLKMTFEYGRMPDGSGWLVKRVK